MANPQIASQNLLPDNGNTLEIPGQSSRGDSSGADPNRRIIDAIIQTESSGRPHAMGKAGEIGLMQIMPQTGIRLGVSPPQLFDPAVNRQVGTRYFNMLLSKYGGDTEKALWAYNAGPARVDSGHVPDSARSYARKVLAAAGGMVGKLMGEGTADAAEAPPLPKGWSEMPTAAPASAGGAAPTAPPLPKGWAEMAPAVSKPLPWAVRAGDYAPMVGQFGGSLAAGLASGAATLGSASPLGAAAGATLGVAGGERIKNAVRSHYGLPQDTQGEMALNEGISGVSEWVGIKALTPGMRKAVSVAQTGYQAARGQAEAALQGLEKLLGKTRGAAAIEEGSISSGRALKDAVISSQDQAFKHLGDGYQQILGPYYQNRTAQGLNRAFAQELGKVKAFGFDLPPQLKELIRTSPGTVESAQKIASTASQLARKTGDNDVMASALGNIARAAQKDVTDSLPPALAGSYKLLYRQYAETVGAFANHSKVIKALNVPSAAEETFQVEKSSIMEHLNALDRLPANLRETHYQALRDGFASSVMRAANDTVKNDVAGGALAELNAAHKVLNTVPEDLFRKLYPGMSKESWNNTYHLLVKNQKDLLKNHDEAVAVAGTIQKYLQHSPGMMNYLRHHAMFSLLVLGTSAYGYESGEWAKAAGIIFGATVWMKASASVKGAKLFQDAIKSPTAALRARKILDALNAVATEELKRGVGIGRGNDDAKEAQN
jgi:hypothetical protein